MSNRTCIRAVEPCPDCGCREAIQRGPGSDCVEECERCALADWLIARGTALLGEDPDDDANLISLTPEDAVTCGKALRTPLAAPEARATEGEQTVGELRALVRDMEHQLKHQRDREARQTYEEKMKHGYAADLIEEQVLPALRAALSRETGDTTDKEVDRGD